MATKKIVKPNILRGKIFDKLAECFGESVLGMYDGKLRIEWIDEVTGEVVQFSLAPVVHKTLVEEDECDQLVPIAEQIATYDAAKAAADAEKGTKKTKKAKKDQDDFPVIESIPAVPVELTDEEQAKLDDLNKLLDSEF